METGYLLTLALTIENPVPLWQAAAALAMASPGMTIEDVTETIGPREAPNVPDCLALLLQPERFVGCEIQSLDVIDRAPPAAAPFLHGHVAGPARHYHPFDMLGAVRTPPVEAAFKSVARLD